MISTVAVGTDGSGTATKAVEAGIDLAARYGATVVFISAYRPVDQARLKRERRDAPDDVQWAINPHEDVDSLLGEAGALADAKGVRWTTDAAQGDAADVLVELAGKHNADVLVIGNKGMQRRVLGSVPNSVTHNAPCSVLVVKTT